MWLQGSADTVCPTREWWHRYSILFTKLSRGRDDTYRRCELMPLTFNLGGHGTCRWCRSTFSICTPTSKFLGLTIQKIWRILCVCVSWPVTLTFDCLTLKLVHNIARVIGYPLANFSDTTAIRYRFMGHWANTAQTDHATLRPWFLTLEVTAPVADAGRRPPSVYQVSNSEDMAHDVCQN